MSLRPKARRFLRTHSGFRAKIATASKERSGALVVSKRVG
jgi:hypothetical protein